MRRTKTKHHATTTIMMSCFLLWLVLAINDIEIIQAFQMRTITPTGTSSTSIKDNSSKVSARKQLCPHSTMGWSTGWATARTSSINKERSKLYSSSRKNIGSSLFFGFGRCDVEAFSGSTTSTALFMTVTSSRQDQTSTQDEETSMPGSSSTTSADTPNEHINSSSYNPTSSSLQEEQEQQEQPLSDIDTQVLRSLLEDQPDLAMEENIQRLLRKNELWEQQQLEKQQQQQDGGESFTSNTKKSSKFSSKTMQDIEESGGGDIFWNSIKAKAGDLLGQVGLAILNKIERDLTVSLSLGAFFLERAARDTSRALKAATTSSAQKKVVYSLNSNSSYVEKQTFQLPSESSSEYDLLHQDPTEQPPTGYTLRADVDLREELNTPADEFKSVTKGIVEILKSGGTTATATKSSTTSKKSGDGSSSSSSSSSSSTFNVVRGDDDHNKRLGFVVGRTSGSRTERGQRAYKARKETVLKREKEFVGKKVIRTTTDVMVDGSWQLKEELRKEPAGYKTKVLRQQVSRNVQNVIEGASSVARAALQTSRAQKDRLLSSSTSEEDGNDTPYVAGEEQAYQQREGDGTASPGTDTSSKTASRASTSASSSTMKRYVEHLTKMLKESKRNLLLNLQVCLEDPRDTWLVESVLMDRDTILRTNSDALSNIVQQMVKLRDELLDDTDPTKQTPEDTESSSTTNNINDKVSYLREEMEVLAYRIENLHISATKAVGSGAAQLLLKELVWDIPFVDGDTASILLPELPTMTEDDDTTTTATTTKEEQEENVPFFARTSSKQVWEEEDGDDEEEEEDLFLWPDQENDSEAPIKTVLVRRRDIMSSDELKTDEYESMKPAFTNTEGGNSSAFRTRKNNVMDADVTDDTDDNNMYNDGVTTVEFEFSGGGVGAGSTVGTSIGDNRAGGGSDNAFDIEVISGDDNDFDFNPSRVKQASGESSSNNNSRYDNTKFNDVGEYGTELANESDRPPNFLQELALRSLDVAFYVAEKTFVEVVPTAVEGGQLAYKRYDQAQKQGLGQEGWQPLDNVQDAARRY